MSRSLRSALGLLSTVLMVPGAGTCDQPGRPPSLRFHHLTTDEGLSDSTVEAILQDSRGFMWFGTVDGLNRYDGYQFKVYTPDEEDPGSIIGGYVWDLYEDSAGVLWVGTSQGLSRYDRASDTFSSFSVDPEDDRTLSSGNAQDIFEDSRGALWVATGLGLNRLDPATDTFVRYFHDPQEPDSLSHDNVQVLFEDSRNRFWVGTQGGLDLFDPEIGGFRHYRHDPLDSSSLSHNFIRGIEEDRFGHLWVSTEDGLNRLSPDRPDRFVRYKYDPSAPGSIQDNQVWVVLEDSKGVLWVGTDRGGLAYYDRKRDSFVHYLHDPADPASISSNVVYVIYEDDNGDLWTGNYAGGVNYLDRASSAIGFFTHSPGDPESLNHQSVLSFLQTRDGAVWVGTEDGMAAFDLATGRFTRLGHDPLDPSGLTAPAVLSLHEDRDGVFWVGTYNGGLSRFDGRRSFVRVPLVDEESPSSERSQIWSIEDDAYGNLWVGTSGGLYRMDRASGAFRLYRFRSDDPTSLRHDYVWDVHEDARGRLWVGTHDGFGRYDRELDAFINYTHDPDDDTSLSFNQINAIGEDSEGRLWLATQGGGLNLFDPERGTFSAVRLVDGLPSNVVLSILPDDQGYLWLGTNRGLSRYDPRAGKFLNLDAGDGLQGNQFNRGAVLRLRDGTLFVGGINGFNVFHSGDLAPNEVPPPVVLTGLEIFNRSVPIGEGHPLSRQIGEAELVTLRHDQSVLTFQFAALNYRNSLRNQYAYMLEGFDGGWREAGTERSATYTNLDPGRYTFRVKGSNNSGVWNEEGAAIQVIVLPPVWATWWFRLLSVLAVTVLIFGIYWLRVRTITRHNLALQAEIGERQRAEAERAKLIAEMESKNIMLERQNAELERFAYTVSHDLKSPLVTIRGFLGLLRRDAETLDVEAMNRDIEQIEVASQTMRKLLEDVLELSRVGRIAHPSEEVPLSELAREAVDLISGAIEARGVEVEIDPQMPAAYCDRLRLVEVFQNLIENAVRFMGAQERPQVSVGGSQENGRIVCYVRDNGQGIEPKYHDRIFGLFDRLDPNVEGSGIGLALVKRIVEVHGGRIWVESEGRGDGATFWFTLADGAAGRDSPAVGA